MLHFLKVTPAKVLDAVYGLAIVTVAVTFGMPAPRATQAEQVRYEVVLTNNVTKSVHPWQKRTYESYEKCAAALGNLNEFLAGVANEDTAAKVPEIKGAEPDLAESVSAVAMLILMNTGKLPDLGISCRAKGIEGRPA